MGVFGPHFQQIEHQPGMVANPARGQLKREKKEEMESSLYTVAPECLVSRVIRSAIQSRVSLLVLHNHVEFGVYLRNTLKYMTCLDILRTGQFFLGKMCLGL